MKPAILISQCLQSDFVRSLGRHDPLPNVLHIGYEEAQRLLGNDPQQGPVATFMRWAYGRSDAELKIVHVRDWHDPNDPQQKLHLKQFGLHCIRDTSGAAFVFEQPTQCGKDVAIVESLTLNDFHQTTLQSVLSPFQHSPRRVGLIGVWTEAKITFLAYELATRYPQFELGLCSALCASSTRLNHFIALDQLAKLFGVQTFSSLGLFAEFLAEGSVDLVSTLPVGPQAAPAQFSVEGEANIPDDAQRLLRYLFRDSRQATFRALDGGFSGNLVLASHSTDLLGHAQVPHVVKIGPQEAIGKERTSFERIESVLGNIAPRISEFADLGTLGAIKYRYASMGGGISTSFQKLYMRGADLQTIKRVLTRVFAEQLGRLYNAARREKADLLGYYCFSSEFAPRVRERVEHVLQCSASAAELPLAAGIRIPNVVKFYEEFDSLPRNPGDSVYFSYVHGDLNGANIILDEHENVWLIDFFHTHYGHVLRDLAKLENDLLYIFTPINSEVELIDALGLSEVLLKVQDLGEPLPEAGGSVKIAPPLMRAYETIRHLRSFYPKLVGTDRDTLQLLVAQLRYAVHTLSFEESNQWQKRWALYTAAQCATEIDRRMKRLGPLRVDWLDSRYCGKGSLGLTILPGRKDYGRDLEADLRALAGQGVKSVVCLLSHEELQHYGTDGLLSAYQNSGFKVKHLPIFDQCVCSIEEMRGLVAWIDENLRGGVDTVMHCVGGLGRSGMAAACFLKSKGLAGSAAIAEVRKVRSPRAIETKEQEQFVERF